MTAFDTATRAVRIAGCPNRASTSGIWKEEFAANVTLDAAVANRLIADGWRVATI